MDMFGKENEDNKKYFWDSKLKFLHAFMTVTIIN